MIIYRDAIATFVEYLKFIRVKITRYVVINYKCDQEMILLALS